ncbi:MAG: glycosyltransferase [Deltaproteobacteria bacterium]|nr:glycosyltransferase [Deltaproteobacteria bacterium]
MTFSDDMNIAVSIAITGGIGGIERNIFTFTKALTSYSIDIYTMQFIPRGFVPRGKNVTIKWFEKKESDLYIALDDQKYYDLYFYYAACQPIYIGDHLNVGKKIIVPNGNDIRAIENRFDHVICQADDGIRYFSNNHKKISITPCVIIPVNRTEYIPNIPDQYFLTVFNPYDRESLYEDGLKPTKGYDLIYELADHMTLPLIWCHSGESLPVSHNIKNHPNIIHFSNLAQEKLYYLYENATAYVSFSREESFGWSLADAIMFDKPIISRNIGIISSLNKDQPGLYIYHDKDQLLDLLHCKTFHKGNYDKAPFSPVLFKNKILALAGKAPAVLQ